MTASGLLGLSGRQAPQLWGGNRICRRASGYAPEGRPASNATGRPWDANVEVGEGLAACDCPHNQERLLAFGDRFRQGSIGSLEREILRTRKKPHKISPVLCHVVANRSTKHGILCFERVEYRTLRDLPIDLHPDFAVDLRELAQVVRKHDSNHDNV